MSRLFIVGLLALMVFVQPLTAQNNPFLKVSKADSYLSEEDIAKTLKKLHKKNDAYKSSNNGTNHPEHWERIQELESIPYKKELKAIKDLKDLPPLTFTLETDLEPMRAVVTKDPISGMDVISDEGVPSGNVIPAGTEVAVKSASGMDVKMRDISVMVPQVVMARLYVKDALLGDDETQFVDLGSDVMNEMLWMIKADRMRLELQEDYERKLEDAREDGMEAHFEQLKSAGKPLPGGYYWGMIHDQEEFMDESEWTLAGNEMSDSREYDRKTNFLASVSLKSPAHKRTTFYGDFKTMYDQGLKEMKAQLGEPQVFEKTYPSLMKFMNNDYENSRSIMAVWEQADQTVTYAIEATSDYNFKLTVDYQAKPKG